VTPGVAILDACDLEFILGYAHFDIARPAPSPGSVFSGRYDVLGTPKSFRTLISGTLISASGGNLVQPSAFVQRQFP